MDHMTINKDVRNVFLKLEQRCTKTYISLISIFISLLPNNIKTIKSLIKCICSYFSVFSLPFTLAGGSLTMPHIICLNAPKSWELVDASKA